MISMWNADIITVPFYWKMTPRTLMYRLIDATRVTVFYTYERLCALFHRIKNNEVNSWFTNPPAWMNVLFAFHVVTEDACKFVFLHICTLITLCTVNSQCVWRKDLCQLISTFQWHRTMSVTPEGQTCLEVIPRLLHPLLMSSYNSCYHHRQCHSASSRVLIRDMLQNH